MKHKTYFVYLVLAAALTGCLKVQNKDEAAAVKAAPKLKPSATQQVQINRELRLDDVFVEPVGLNQPNIYDVHFSWPQAKDRIRLSINNKVLTVLETKTTQQWIMSNLQGGTTFSLLIEILDEQNHIISSETREIEIPKDYVFSKSLKLTNHLKIQSQRVFMNDSIITTENFDLEIQAEQLIILKRSYIQNYFEGSKANPGSAGRNGGSIYINVTKAVGDLDITMNSESGGNGFKGYQTGECPINASIGCFILEVHCPQGGHGYSAGQNGQLTVKVKDTKDFNLYSQEQISRGGEKGPYAESPTADDYPMITNQTEHSACVRGGVQPKGADATPGKICLMLSDSIPQAGCE